MRIAESRWTQAMIPPVSSSLLRACIAREICWDITDSEARHDDAFDQLVRLLNKTFFREPELAFNAVIVLECWISELSSKLI